MVGHRWALALAALMIGLFPASAPAAIFLGSGLSPENSNSVSAKADFSIVGDVLTLVLTNTTAGGTKAQGDALTGVVFDLTKSPLPNLTLASIALTSGSKIYTSSGINNATALSGSWTDDLAGAVHDFGVATTGFNGLFVGGSISRGNASPDYGIIAGTGTNGTGSMRTPFDGSKRPLILNSLTFKFNGAKGLTESQITDVSFLFGTAGGALIGATLDQPPETLNHVNGDLVSAPEPSSLIVFGLVFVAVGGYGRLRRRAG